MELAIRHFPDRKKPCLVLKEGNRALVLGYLTDEKRETWLRKALMGVAIELHSMYTLDEIIEGE